MNVFVVADRKVALRLLLCLMRCTGIVLSLTFLSGFGVVILNVFVSIPGVSI